MKKISKGLMALLLVIIVFLLASPAVFAGSASHTLTHEYLTVYQSNGGINKNITIKCINQHGVGHHNDVRMLGENGDVVWEEYGAVEHNGTRTFWCGPNVYAIQVRVAPKDLVGLLWPRRGECTVSW